MQARCRHGGSENTDQAEENWLHGCGPSLSFRINPAGTAEQPETGRFPRSKVRWHVLPGRSSIELPKPSS